jgi:hypothetical protein
MPGKRPRPRRGGGGEGLGGDPCGRPGPCGSPHPSGRFALAVALILPAAIAFTSASMGENSATTKKGRLAPLNHAKFRAFEDTYGEALRLLFS